MSQGARTPGEKALGDETPHETPDSLAGRRVLLVEDESLVAFLLEDMIETLGCTLAASVASVGAALALVDAIAVDVAVLDINVAGAPVFPVAERLAKRGVPIVFSTGYGAAGLPDRWRGAVVVAKPYDIDRLAAALRAALG